MTMDPRLAERRRAVAEERAKQTVRRLLRFLTVVAFGALAVWFMLSPYMSAREVALEGVTRSDAAGILARHDVVPGRPLILIRPGSVEEALEADPWVADATVDVAWPDRVVVSIAEREPRAWVETSGGWTLRDEEGVVLPSEGQSDDTLGRVRLAGMANDDPALLANVVGSIEFLMSLPEDLARSVEIRLQEGELWANVAGWEVRLGRADEMREKALSLAMLLAEEELEQGAVIVLIAPTRPSVLPPASSGEEASPEGEGEAPGAGGSGGETTEETGEEETASGP